jgi:hypothetical protein
MTPNELAAIMRDGCSETTIRIKNTPDFDMWTKNPKSVRMRDEGMFIEDERAEYTAPIVALGTVKEAVSVWQPAERTELYKYLNYVWQCRM